MSPQAVTGIQILPVASGSSPTFRASGVIASTSPSTPTIIATWTSQYSGILTTVYLNSLDLLVENVSAYILPRGVTAGTDAMLMGPKNVEIILKDNLDFDLTSPIFLHTGDQIAFSSTLGSNVMALICMEEYKR